MQRPLTIKTGVVFALSLLLWIPLSMIGSLVAERSNRQIQVTEDIAASSSGAQRLFGPVLAVPYTEQWLETVDTVQNGVAMKEQRSRMENYTLYFLPDQLLTKGSLAVETKQRGLFKVRSYVLDARMEGRFSLPAEYGKPKPRHNGTLTFGAPYLAVSIADMRGVLEAQGVEWNDRHHEFEQGAYLPYGRVTGMHAPLADQEVPGADVAVPFVFSLKLRGLEELNFVPTGKHTRVELASPWPHPSFQGRFLPNPDTQEVGPEGFRAAWTVNALATNVVENLHQCRDIGCFDSFGLKLIDPVNIYSMSGRATKYGFLFIGLAFAAIFLFEVAKKMAIHPAQYTLVGLALAMFFLLLLSLSEHLAFNLSYAIAASATAGLTGFYLSAVLGSLARGSVAGGLLAGLFAALYGLLQSEDNALMLGSLLLFALLALAMVVTRRIDWYRLAPPVGEPEDIRPR
jgi:inner membrane protein